MAASLVVRLQSIVSRTVAASDTAVVTVGPLHAGTAHNIIPDTAELGLSVRTLDSRVREQVLAAIERLAKAEAFAVGAERDPDVTLVESFPAVLNDAEACARVADAFAALPKVRVVDPGGVTGSEDVGIFAIAAEAPCAYWLLGGSDPALFAGATSVPELAALVAEQPSNHSPFFAPVPQPTLSVGTAALVQAAKAWHGPREG